MQIPNFDGPFESVQYDDIIHVSESDERIRFFYENMACVNFPHFVNFNENKFFFSI
jgi:hypothetical protein